MNPFDTERYGFMDEAVHTWYSPDNQQIIKTWLYRNRMARSLEERGLLESERQMIQADRILRIEHADDTFPAQTDRHVLTYNWFTRIASINSRRQYILYIENDRQDSRAVKLRPRGTNPAGRSMRLDNNFGFCIENGESVMFSTVLYSQENCILIARWLHEINQILFRADLRGPIVNIPALDLDYPSRGHSFYHVLNYDIPARTIIITTSDGRRFWLLNLRGSDEERIYDAMIEDERRARLVAEAPSQEEEAPSQEDEAINAPEIDSARQAQLARQIEIARRVEAERTVPPSDYTCAECSSELSSKDATIRRLTNELEALKMKMQCTICMEREVDTSFGQCGHLFCNVCIEDPRITICPKCRSQGKNVKRVYYEKYLKYKLKYHALKK